MADLQSNAPQMFQLPGPQVPYQGNMGTGAAAGMQAGMQQYQAQIALQQQQQQIQQKKQEMEQQKNEKMLEVGADMLINGGDDVQETGQRLIGQALPFVTGQPIPPNVAIDKPLAKGIQYYHNAVKLYREDPTNPLALSPKDAVAGILQDISRKGLKQQTAQMDILKADPMYKEGTADQVGGQVNGQPAVQNKFSGDVSSPSGQPMPGAQGSFIDSGQAATLQNSLQNNAASEFQDVSKDQKEILDNGTNFLNMLAPKLPDNPTPEQKAEFALHDKQAVLKYIQMQVPSSKRPPNMTMEELAKSSLLSQQAKAAYNQTVVDGSPLSNELRDALLQTGGQTILTHEGILSQNENSVAARAVKNRVDPTKTLTNLRSPSVPSSSSFFPSQNVPGKAAQTGQIIKGDDGFYVFRGQPGTADYKDPNNWMKIK